MKQLLKLCKEKHFQLVICKITVNEIKANYKKRAKVAIVKYNEIVNDKANVVSVLKNNSTAKAILQKVPDSKIVEKDFNDRLDNALIDASAIILEYPTINTTQIFEDYFGNTFPFNTGDKKNEFPDAFAIAQLEEWCKKNKSSCIVFSKDKDFLKTKRKTLNIQADHGKFLDDYLKTTDSKRINLLTTLYSQNDSEINSTIENWIKDKLDDTTKYWQFTNGFDLHDLEVKEVTVLEKDYQITGLDDENILIEISALVYYKVEVTIDDESSGIYDSDDKEMFYTETTTLVLENNSAKLLISLEFFIVDDNDYSEDFEVIDINEGKDLDIDFEGRGEYF